VTSTNSKSETKRHGTLVADKLIVRGAREHNLKDISLELPRDYQVLVNLHLHLTQFLLKDNVAM
jgi:hypothetical protein